MQYKFVLALFACVAVSAQPAKNPFSGDPGAVDGGRLVFRIYCSPCHGIVGQGGRAPDLSRGVYASAQTDADLFHVVSNGISGTEMAGFGGGDINDDDIWRIVTFIRSMARRDTAAIPGNKAAGERLFWGKGGCGNCHMVNGKGGGYGPELSRVGRERSFQYLRESVVEPNKDVAPGFATITVVRRDGTQLRGVQRGFDEFSVQFTDGQHYYSFLRSELTSVKREMRSVMPDSYGRMFTATELDDLLAYLVSLGGVEGKQ